MNITPHAEAWIKYNYMNALVSIGKCEEGKQIAMEISIKDQFLKDARALTLDILAYIAHKEDEKKNAAAFIESFNGIALNKE